MTIKEKIYNFNDESRKAICQHFEKIDDWYNKLVSFYRDSAFDFQTYLKIIMNTIHFGESMKSKPEDILNEIKRILNEEYK